MEYQQMTFWDYIKPEPPLSLDNLDEVEMVRIISHATGLDFKKMPNTNRYESKVKHVTFSVHYSKFTVEPFTKFISCGWDDKKDKSGCGSPCETVDKAIDFFKKGLKRL